MSSTCVLLAPPTTFNRSASRDLSTNLTRLTPRGGMTMAQNHPALRGWAGIPSPAETPFTYTTANEVMKGSVTLLSTTQPQRILLSVIRTSVDHLALVYPENRRNLKCVKPAGCINLRGVTCELIVLGDGITGITLRPKKCDTSSAHLTFVCPDPVLLDGWMSALGHVTSDNKIPKQCSLPSLEEEEE